MRHTDGIIERSIDVWSEWPGRRIASAAAFDLHDGTGAEEVRVTLSPPLRPYFISWQQEDGASDQAYFHWLSVQNTSHFKEGVLKRKESSLILSRLRDSTVQSVELFGVSELDAIVAAFVITQGCAIGLATARELPNNDRLSRFGGAELVVADVARLRAELSRQGIERLLRLSGE